MSLASKGQSNYAVDEEEDEPMEHDDLPVDNSKLESSPRSLRSTRSLERDARNVLVDALALAAVRLRDAELELNAAREHYGQALNAFNRCVAPVSGAPA